MCQSGRNRCKKKNKQTHEGLKAAFWWRAALAHLSVELVAEGEEGENHSQEASSGLDAGVHLQSKSSQCRENHCTLETQRNSKHHIKLIKDSLSVKLPRNQEKHLSLCDVIECWLGPIKRPSCFFVPF